MCAEAPVSVFHLVAAGLDSQEERSEAARSEEVQPALRAGCVLVALRLCGTSGAALSALGWSLLCPDAGIAFSRLQSIGAQNGQGCHRMRRMQQRQCWQRGGQAGMAQGEVEVST